METPEIVNERVLTAEENVDIKNIIGKIKQKFADNKLEFLSKLNSAISSGDFDALIAYLDIETEVESVESLINE